MLQHEYAKAIFELAGNSLAFSIGEELNLVVKLLEDNDFNLFINSPSIKIDDKKNVINKSFKEFNELTLNFLYVLLDNRRFYLINEIYEEYDKLLLDMKNTVNVKLYSSIKFIILLTKFLSFVSSDVKFAKILLPSVLIPAILTKTRTSFSFNLFNSGTIPGSDKVILPLESMWPKAK